MIKYFDNWNNQTENRNGIRSVFFGYEKYYIDDETGKKVTNKNFDIKLAKQVKNEKTNAMRIKDYPPLGELADAIYWEKKGKPEKMDAYVAKCDKVKADHPLEE